MTHPQAVGALQGTVRRKGFLGLFGFTERATCAMGAAHEAAGVTSRPATPEEEATGGSPYRGVPTTGHKIVVAVEPEEWQRVLWSYVRCPECSRSDHVFRIVPHLNDDHRWIREEIAAWIEQFESTNAAQSEVTRGSTTA